jgi:hypothetical protein
MHTLMQTLSVHPFPQAETADPSPNASGGMDGFVDEAVIRALMARPIFTPTLRGDASIVAAPGSVLDFAGWDLFATKPSPVEIPSSSTPASPARPILESGKTDLSPRLDHPFAMAC